jgi:hypothetical protein
VQTLASKEYELVQGDVAVVRAPPVRQAFSDYAVPYADDGG